MMQHQGRIHSRALAIAALTLAVFSAAPDWVEAAPDLVHASRQSCTIFPALIDWLFTAFYWGCAGWFLVALGIRLAGKMRARILVYPIWTVLLMIPVQISVEAAAFAALNEKGYSSCYAP